MDPIVIKFFGDPVAKGRPRMVSLGGKPHAFTPAKTRKYEAALSYAANLAMEGRPLLRGALSVSIVVSLPFLTSWSGVQRKKALLGYIKPVKRPDIDNYVKTVFDALNCVVFQDDSQVTNLTVSKIYDEKPGIWIEVSQIRELKMSEEETSDAGTGTSPQLITNNEVPKNEGCSA